MHAYVVSQLLQQGEPAHAAACSVWQQQCLSSTCQHLCHAYVVSQYMLLRAVLCNSSVCPQFNQQLCLHVYVVRQLPRQRGTASNLCLHLLPTGVGTQFICMRNSPSPLPSLLLLQDQAQMLPPRFYTCKETGKDSLAAPDDEPAAAPGPGPGPGASCSGPTDRKACRKVAGCVWCEGSFGPGSCYSEVSWRCMCRHVSCLDWLGGAASGMMGSSGSVRLCSFSTAMRTGVVSTTAVTTSCCSAGVSREPTSGLL